MSYGNISPEVVDAILKQHDIADVVGKYIHLTKQGRNLIGLCPFHSEKTPSFSVNPEKNFFYCFGCNAGGNVITFFMEIEGYSYPEAIRHLAEDANIVIEWADVPEEQSEEHKEREILINAHDLTAKLFHYLLRNTDHGKEAMAYLQSRGFSHALIETFQIGYAPSTWDTLPNFLTQRGFQLPLMEKGGLLSARADGSGYVDRFRGRIMFPICDVRGKVIAFAGRVLGEGQPKYLNTPETVLFNKSRMLYNYHQAKASIRKTGTIILFEGYADVIKAWEAGVTNGVATMGTALSEHHARMMSQNAEQIIICYDGDDAGQTAANKNIAILGNTGCNVKVSMIPQSMDPDEYISAHGANAFKQEMIEGAVAATKFRLYYLSKSYALQEDEGKLRYIREALKVVAQLSSPTEREHYLKELATDYAYSLDALKQELHQIREVLQKERHYGDNIENSWNNVMNDRRVAAKTPSLFPAYHNAERKLLAVMMHDRDIAIHVQQQLADQFNVEAHAALAAYLYSYYAEGNEPDVGKFIGLLRDDKLMSSASSISMNESNHGVNPQVISDYIREILKFPQQKEIERKKDEMIQAERTGDISRATLMASEIITLERQLKSL